MITYKDLQGKLKTLNDKAVKNAVSKLQKESKRKDLGSVIENEYGNGADYAVSFYFEELKNTEIGLLWLLFGNPGWDGYEDKGSEDVIRDIIESAQYDDAVWDFETSIPAEIEKFCDLFADVYERYLDGDDDLSEANKYFFGTENSNEVKKLFEGENKDFVEVSKVMESCAKDFNRFLLKLSKGDVNSRYVMIKAALKSNITVGSMPWEGTDMVLGLFEESTEWPQKVDLLDLYPFTNSDGDTAETYEDVFPVCLPLVDIYLKRYCTKGFTALWNKIHPEDIRTKVTYSDFCGEEHYVNNDPKLSFKHHAYPTIKKDWMVTRN